MSLPTRILLSICTAWLLTWQTGVAGAQPRVVDSFEVGPNTYVRALTVDFGANALWVGTSKGVIEVDLKTLTPRHTFNRDDGLANEYVFAVGIDRLGYKWFGTNAGGVSRYRDGDWKTYFPMHGLADFWVYAFANQGKNTLWIGTWAGVNRFDLASGRFETFREELVNEWVYGIAVDAQDQVWFGTEGGVSRFDGRKWRSWTHADGLGLRNDAALPASRNTGLGTRQRHDLSVSVDGQDSYNPSYVFSVLAASDGAIWAGTWGGGAARFDGKAWHSFGRQHGLAGNIVYSMVQDSKGALWFGTDRGVSRYWQGQFTTVDIGDGPGAHVYALTVAPDDTIWAGTLSRVSRIAP